MTETKTVIVIEGIASAKFFSNTLQTLKVLVETDDSVLVWDRVAGHYTRWHSLSRASQKRIARKVRQGAKGGSN